MQPYEMIMKIDKRKGNEITGTLEWPIVKCRTQFQGFIIDKNISFTESAVIEGRGIVVPTVYLGKVDKETIAGTWLHEEKNSVASGEFRISKFIYNGADARQEEKKTNIRAAELTPAMKLLSDANKKACTDLSQANNGPRISVDVPVLRPDQTYSDEIILKPLNYGRKLLFKEISKPNLTWVVYISWIKKDMIRRMSGSRRHQTAVILMQWIS